MLSATSQGLLLISGVTTPQLYAEVHTGVKKKLTEDSFFLNINSWSVVFQNNQAIPELYSPLHR